MLQNRTSFTFWWWHSFRERLGCKRLLVSTPALAGVEKLWSVAAGTNGRGGIEMAEALPSLGIIRPTAFHSSMDLSSTTWEATKSFIKGTSRALKLVGETNCRFEMPQKKIHPNEKLKGLCQGVHTTIHEKYIPAIHITHLAVNCWTRIVAREILIAN